MGGLENNQELSTFFEKAFVSEMLSSLHNNGSATEDSYRIAILPYDLATFKLISL